jgi:putative DNA primase/helicase
LCLIDFDPDAECPLWDATLHRFLGGDPDLIDYWQRLCGCAMSGVIRDHVMPIAYGTGANGKSTILGALLGVIGPDYAMKASSDLLMSRKGESHPTDKTDLFGKRLVVVIETESGSRLNESFVKEATGGDSIRARRMREDFWEFTPSHTLIMATNHRPTIRGSDNGIWRRLKLVPFAVSVTGHEIDPAMPEKLRAEYPGILNWCIRGCLAWQQHGLQEPPCVADATAEYRSEQDRFGGFLEQHTVTDTNGRVRCGELYGLYKEYAANAGEFIMSQTAFGTEMTDRGFQRKKSGDTWYIGLCLRRKGDAYEAEEDYPF